MNKEALKDLYTLFVNNGYKDSMAEFITLLNENEDAYSDAFTLFKNAGYRDGEAEFATLIGIERPLKKKEEGMVSPSEDGSLASSETEDAANIMPPEYEGPSAKEEEIAAMSPYEKIQYDLNQSRSRVVKTYVPTYEEGGELSPKYYGKRATATAPAIAFKNYQSNSLPLIVAPFCFAFSFLKTKMKNFYFL